MNTVACRRVFLIYPAAQFVFLLCESQLKKFGLKSPKTVEISSVKTPPMLYNFMDGLSPPPILCMKMQWACHVPSPRRVCILIIEVKN